MSTVEYEREELSDECFAKARAYADVRVEAAFGSASARAVIAAQYAMVEAIDRLAGLTGHAGVTQPNGGKP